ncbi:MAG: leukotoxin LktA family filamentous adhesin [Cyanobacteriota bacterium]
MNIRKVKKINHKNIGITLSLLCTLSIAYTICLNPVSAQQIIIDGNTNTNLSINGNTTTVTTSTIKNDNAFNSFNRFNVDKGNTVNLIVPGNATHLINLVNSEKTNINGTLNALKNNKVGGNVYLVNPHGIVIGIDGVVNVGSLTAVTPTQNFMNGFFKSKGNPDEASLNALVNGKMPVNSNAKIINEGVINVDHKGTFITGTFENFGKLYSCAVFDDSDLNNIVNMNTFEKGVNMTNQNGEILITAENDVNSMGNIVANQKIPYNVLFHSKNGNVNVAANIVGRVNAQADNGNVNLIQFNNDLNVFKVEAKNDANLIAFGSIKDGNKDTEDANILAKNINMISIFGDIGNKADNLNILTNHNSTNGILNAWSFNGEINLHQSNNKLSIDSVAAKNDVCIISENSIVDGSPGENPNITGHNIMLMSHQGNIGYNYIDQDLDIHSNANNSLSRGVVHAFAPNGTIALEEINGDLFIEKIHAGGTASIKALGNIVGVSPDVDIIAKNINLTSSYGSISGEGRNLIVDVDNPSCMGTSVHYSGKGTLAAAADNEVKITDIAGDLLVDYAMAGNNVEIVAEENIVNGAQLPQLNIISGSNVYLKSYSGGIGDSYYGVVVDTKGGGLNAEAVKDIYIDGNGDLYVNSVETLGNVTLKAYNNLYSYDPGKINVKGADINLYAQYAIGSTSAPLNVKSSTKKVKTSAKSTNVIQY